ncbi:hypothetical protein C9J85_19595 [Haloferax sp. wsp5]|nr:hypothetical protein C9J85_19595 [Haloferax sp. wsp5]
MYHAPTSGVGDIPYKTPIHERTCSPEGVNKAEQELAGSDYRMVTVDFNVEPVGQIDVDPSSTAR